MLVKTKSVMVAHLQVEKMSLQKKPLQQLLNHTNPNFHFYKGSLHMCIKK